MKDETAWSTTHSIALVSRVIFYWVWITVGIVLLVLAFRGYLAFQAVSANLTELVEPAEGIGGD